MYFFVQTSDIGSFQQMATRGTKRAGSPPAAVHEKKQAVSSLVYAEELVGEPVPNLEEENEERSITITVQITNLILLEMVLKSIRPSVNGKDGNGEILCVVQQNMPVMAKVLTGEGMFYTDTQEVAATLRRPFSGFIFFVQSTCKTRQSMALFETTVHGIPDGVFFQRAINSADLLHALKINNKAMQAEWVFTAEMSTMTIEETTSAATSSEIMVEFPYLDTESTRATYEFAFTQLLYQQCVRINALTCSKKLQSVEDNACTLTLQKHWFGKNNHSLTKILTLSSESGCKMINLFMKENEPSASFNLDLRQTVAKAPKAPKNSGKAEEEVLIEEDEAELQRLMDATMKPVAKPIGRITAKQVRVWKQQYLEAVHQAVISDGEAQQLNAVTAEYYQLMHTLEFSGKNLVNLFKDQVNELSDGISLMFGGQGVLAMVMPLRPTIFLMHIVSLNVTD